MFHLVKLIGPQRGTEEIEKETIFQSPQGRAKEKEQLIEQAVIAPLDTSQYRFVRYLRSVSDALKAKSLPLGEDEEEEVLIGEREGDQGGNVERREDLVLPEVGVEVAQGRSSSFHNNLKSFYFNYK